MENENISRHLETFKTLLDATVKTQTPELVSLVEAAIDAGLEPTSAVKGMTFSIMQTVTESLDRFLQTTEAVRQALEATASTRIKTQLMVDQSDAMHEAFCAIAILPFFNAAIHPLVLKHKIELSE